MVLPSPQAAAAIAPRKCRVSLLRKSKWPPSGFASEEPWRRMGGETWEKRSRKMFGRSGKGLQVG